VNELVPRRHRRHHKPSSRNCVGEEVAVGGGLVVVGGLLMVRVRPMTVDGRRLRHQLMRLLMLIHAVWVEVMRRRTWRRRSMVVLRLKV